MESPLGLLFAYAFVSDFEEKHMNEMREMGLDLWWRYVDDLYSTVSNKLEALPGM